MLAMLESGQDADWRLAQLLQQQFNEERHAGADPDTTRREARQQRQDETRSLTDPSWELVDPTPNVHVLFVQFARQFFWDRLGSVSVSWSKRMTSCAGVCSYQHRGGECRITLSEPLLKLRPRKDLVETLLHEMIHAYLFVTNNDRDRDGHGPQFQQHMRRINQAAGTAISVYHDFHDEVRQYQQHWWLCDGPCAARPPYFGMVRRAMNRAPGPNDRWWAEHARNCSGSFRKVREPPPPPPRKVGPAPRAPGPRQTDLAGFVRPASIKRGSGSPSPPGKRPCLDAEQDAVLCPVCGERTPRALINQHLDGCVAPEPESEAGAEPGGRRCDLCGFLPPPHGYDRHVERCLHRFFDQLERKYELQAPDAVRCLVCNQFVLRPLLAAHLDCCIVDVLDDDDAHEQQEPPPQQQQQQPPPPPSPPPQESGEHRCPLCLRTVAAADADAHEAACMAACPHPPACPLCGERPERASYLQHVDACLANGAAS